MEKLEISKNIYLYRFEKALEHSVGLNVLLIENNDEALIIDTGYEENFLEIKRDLDKRNIVITNLVVSHFHPDHTGGLKYLKDVNIYGSELAKETMEMFNNKVDHILPNKVIIDERSFYFGNHLLKLEKNPGHSKDGLLITIDDKFMYVADDLVYSHNGKPLFPFCADKNIENHILSIEKIYKNHSHKTIIPSHGNVLNDNDFIEQDLKNRILYLKYIQKNPYCTVEDFKKDTGISFIGNKSHEYNTKKR